MAETIIVDFDGYISPGHYPFSFWVTYNHKRKYVKFYGDLSDIPSIKMDWEPEPEEVWMIIEEYLKWEELQEKKRKRMENPAGHRGEKIYDTVLAIEARKGEESLWPGENFRHEFKVGSGAEVIGNPDGSLTIRSRVGKRLWKKFNYRED